MREMLDLNAKTFDDRVIMEFFEWLNSNNMGIASYEGDCLTWVSKSDNHLLDDYFGIDSVQLEKERRELLEGSTK